MLVNVDVELSYQGGARGCGGGGVNGEAGFEAGRSPVLEPEA